MIEKGSTQLFEDAGSNFSELASFISATIGGVDEEDLEKLSDSIFWVGYDGGDLIVQEGSFSSSVYLVYKGLVKIGKHSGSGRRRVLRFLAPKEWFGLEALFLPDQRTNIQFARALVNSELIFIESTSLYKFLKRHPRALFDLCRWFAREVAMLEFKLTRTSTEGAIQNFSMLLLALSKKYGIKVDSGDMIDLDLSKQTLANSLGVSVETLRRLIKKLGNRNIISVEDSKIIIKNEDKLNEIAECTDFYLSILEETF